MAFQVESLTFDFLSDIADLSLVDDEQGRHLHLSIPLNSAGNKGEAELKQIATMAAKQALQDGLDAL